MGKKTHGSIPRVVHAGQGVLEFPWEQADTLWAAAEKEGMDAVKTALERIRDMLGHPEAIQPITTAWAMAKSDVNDSTDGTTGLKTAKHNMEAVWDSPASKEASRYVTDLIENGGKTEEILEKMVNSIDTFNVNIQNTYKLCIDLIQVFAELVLHVAKNVLDNWKDWFGMGSAIADSLLEFLTKYNEKCKEFMDNVADARKTIVSLQLQASSLVVPEPLSPIGSDANSWTPKRAEK